ncbi:hypothetical protein BDN67DRAFT_1012513 [Paxillus ammoniavirescens]|nr:hypothetical protein BDN67DRAFT_1012513 [Paxillus ammoniavirescens]
MAGSSLASSAMRSAKFPRAVVSTTRRWMRVIKDSIGWELPRNIPYEAKTRLISQFTTLWTAPAERCLTAINDVLDDVIQGLLKTHFGRFRVLQEFVSELIRPDVEEYKSRALSALKETLELDVKPSYTQNTHYFESLCEIWLNSRSGKQRPHDDRVGFADRDPNFECVTISAAGWLPGSYSRRFESFAAP